MTIIVITYNSSHILDRFFRGLSIAGYDFELILIDNASRNQSELPRFIERHNTGKYCKSVRTILNTENLMYTKAVNQGLSSFNTDVVLVMNPDCYGVDEGWLKKMIEHWDKYACEVAGYKLVRDDINIIEHVGARHPGVHLGKGEEDKGQYDKVTLLMGKDEYVTGAAWMLGSHTIKYYGLLDEKNVHYASDREYCIDVRNRGGKIYYFPIRMVHLFGKSSIN